MNKRTNKEKGFTLIEMLVVIAIVGLLSSVVVVGLGGAREKARDARRLADLRSLQNQVELAYQTSTGYPSVSGGGSTVINMTDPNLTPDTGPQNDDYYYYATTTGGLTLTYQFGACLEGPKPAGGVTCATTFSAITCTGKFCVAPQ